MDRDLSSCRECEAIYGRLCVKSIRTIVSSTWVKIFYAVSTINSAHSYYRKDH
jgi:hypothetical protein